MKNCKQTANASGYIYYKKCGRLRHKQTQSSPQYLNKALFQINNTKLTIM